MNSSSLNTLIIFVLIGFEPSLMALRNVSTEGNCELGLALHSSDVHSRHVGTAIPKAAAIVINFAFSIIVYMPALSAVK